MQCSGGSIGVAGRGKKQCGGVPGWCGWLGVGVGGRVRRICIL